LALLAFALPRWGLGSDYWFGDSELFRCRPLGLKQQPSHELCFESIPAKKKGGAKAPRRRFQIAIRDASALGEDQYHHKLVARIAAATGAGEYLDFRRPGFFDLAGLVLIWAPVVHGTPDRFDRGHIATFIYDPKRGRLTRLETRLDCPARCSGQFLSYQQRGGKVKLIHQRRVDGQSLRSTYLLALRGGEGVIESVEQPRSEAELRRGRQAPPSTPVCQRTEQVRKEIERRLDFKSCKKITAEDLATVAFVALRDRGIRRLRPGDFSGLPNLNRIDLSDNPLTALPTGIFAGLFKLRSINLQKCRLGRIPPRIFADLGALKSRYLNHNRIDRLHPDAFAGLDELTFLALNNNRLRSLPPGVFAPLKRLKRPYLGGNPLSTKPRR
jgi:hypothetical protein